MKDLKVVKTGDRVRIVFEGEVSSVVGGTGVILGESVYLMEADLLDDSCQEVEVIPPALEVFKPGDRLRRLHDDYEVTLGDEGYLMHFGGGVGKTVFYPYVGDEGTFNSGSYERVILV